MSFVIASILKPLTNRINNTQIYRIRVPRIIAVILSFLIFIAFFSLFITLFIPVFSAQIEVLSDINYDGLIDKVSGPVKKIENFIIVYNLTDKQEGFLVENMRSGLIQLLREMNFTNILNTVISFTGNFFISAVAVIFITFFLLYEMAPMRKRVIALIPNKYFEVSISALNKIERLFSNYLIGLLFQMFAIFSLASIGLSILGIKYALTIAIFAAVANIIPYLGPLLGATFGIVVGISTSLGFVGSQPYLLL